MVDYVHYLIVTAEGEEDKRMTLPEAFAEIRKANGQDATNSWLMRLSLGRSAEAVVFGVKYTFTWEGFPERAVQKEG